PVHAPPAVHLPRVRWEAQSRRASLFANFLYQCTSRIASTRTLARNQFEQPWHAFLRQGTVADILAGEGLLVHLRAHITGINPVDTQGRIFGGENIRKLFERCFTRSISTPALIGLDTCIAGNIHYTGTRLQLLLEVLDKGKRSDNIRTIYLLKHIEWIIQQVRLWAWAKDTGIIHQCVQPTRFLCGLHESTTMPRIGYIARNSNDPRLLREFRTCCREGL